MVKVGRIGEVWESRKIIGDAGGTWPIWKAWDPEKVMRARSMCPLSPWGGSRSSGWMEGRLGVPTSRLSSSQKCEPRWSAVRMRWGEGERG